MRKLLISGLVFLAVLSQSVMAADEAISDAETAQVVEAIKAWGCDGGVIDKTPSGNYEVEDSTCHGGTYEIDLGPDFVVTSIELD